MKSCFVVVVSLLFVVPSFAQDETKAGFLLFGFKTRIGLNVGVNFSTESLEPEPQTFPGESLKKSGRTDIVVGLPLEIQIARAFSLRLEPTFTQYGYSLERTSSSSNSTTKFMKNYLEFPLTASYNFGTEPVMFFGFFGGVPAFRFCSEDEFSYSFFGPGGGNPSSFQPIVSDIRSSTSKFNFGITAGGGAEYALNNAFSLALDVRYMLGLTNTYKKPDNVTFPPNTVEPVTKLRGFQIRVGGMYSF